MLDDMLDAGVRREAMPIPHFTVEIPKGEDVIRVTWKGVNFVLIPQQKKSIRLFDDVRTEVGQLKENATAGFPESEVMEEMELSLEIPLANVEGRPNDVFGGKTPAFVKANTEMFARYVDGSIDEVQTNAIVAAAKAELMKAAKSWKMSVIEGRDASSDKK